MSAYGAVNQVQWHSPSGSFGTSDGGYIDASFVFELGAFEDGFQPTSSNTASWSSKWHVADRTNFNPLSKRFSSIYDIESNDSPFLKTSQAYIWGYSTTGSSNEWILLTNAQWTWPDTSAPLIPRQFNAADGTEVLGSILNTSAFTLTTALVISGSVPQLTHGEWLLSNFTPVELGITSLSGWTSDPDGDGLTNLVEMALGTEPKIADSSSTLEAKVVPGDNPSSFHLQLELTKVPDLLVDYFVEASTDLTIWSGGDAELEVVKDTPTQLIVRDRVPVSSTNKRFFKLTVQLSN